MKEHVVTGGPLQAATEEGRLKRVAYHEAGHAVVGYLVKCPFMKVSVIPDDDSFGRCTFRKLPEGFDPGTSSVDSIKDRVRIEGHVMSSLPGSLAEKQYAGEYASMPPSRTRKPCWGCCFTLPEVAKN
jgi:hypothetical protein